MTKRNNKKEKLKENDRSTMHSIGDIRVGDISDGKGIAVGHGAQATVTQTTGATVDEIATAFRVLQHKVSTMPDGPDKVSRKTLLNRWKRRLAKVVKLPKARSING